MVLKAGFLPEVQAEAVFPPQKSCVKNEACLAMEFHEARVSVHCVVTVPLLIAAAFTSLHISTIYDPQ